MRSPNRIKYYPGELVENKIRKRKKHEVGAIKFMKKKIHKDIQISRYKWGISITLVPKTNINKSQQNH